MDHVKITNDKIDLNTINELICDAECGAISFFVGTTRNNFESKKVISLEYEAYEAMAIKVMTEICSEMRQKWPDIKHTAIYHRLGVVPVKEASVIIGVSSPHRATSLDAVEFGINELKKKVPIWKKEIYEGENESEWKENHECKWKTSDMTKMKRDNLNNIQRT
uniref:Molybdopterin synthase catalytic subunit n=1 Tax=Culicoides sonorensis TaxID=179676 RepID=A0A336M9H1_CULSO